MRGLAWPNLEPGLVFIADFLLYSDEQLTHNHSEAIKKYHQ